MRSTFQKKKNNLPSSETICNHFLVLLNYLHDINKKIFVFKKNWVTVIPRKAVRCSMGWGAGLKGALRSPGKFKQMINKKKLILMRREITMGPILRSRSHFLSNLIIIITNYIRSKNVVQN